MTGLWLGRTVFKYIHEVSDMLPVLSSFATSLYPPPVASASSDTQVLGPLNIQGQGEMKKPLQKRYPPSQMAVDSGSHLSSLICFCRSLVETS